MSFGRDTYDLYATEFAQQMIISALAFTFDDINLRKIMIKILQNQ